MDTRIVCGTDLRRYGADPEDVARAEVLVHRLGGQVRLYGLSAGCAARWVSEDGLEVTAVASTYGEALAGLQRRVTA